MEYMYMHSLAFHQRHRDNGLHPPAGERQLMYTPKKSNAGYDLNNAGVTNDHGDQKQDDTYQNNKTTDYRRTVHT